MPAIPVYNQQINPQVGGGGLQSVSPIGSAARWGSAVIGIGDMMARRGEQLVQEYDATKAYDAFNELRNQTRDKLNDLLTREGSAAIGAQAEYTEWEKKTRDEIETKALTVPSQRTMFAKIADQHRNSDLNHLAGHEARQNNIYKKTTLAGLGEVMERESRLNAFDDQKLNEILLEYYQAEEGLFPNQSPEERTLGRLKVLQSFRTAAAQELIDKDPKTAAKKLEEWKSDLGDRYDVLKRRLEVEQRETRVTAAYDEMAKLFPHSPAAAIAKMRDENFVKKTFPDLRLDERERIVNAFKSEVVWQRQMRNMAEEQAMDNVTRGVIADMQEGNLKGAEERIYRAAERVDPARALALLERVQNAPYKHSDSDVVKDVFDKIGSGAIKYESEIDILIGRGLNKTDAQIARQMLKDHNSNPMRTQYIKDAENYYDAAFEAAPDSVRAAMEMVKPRVMTRLREVVLEKNLKGEEILDWMVNYVQTSDQVTKTGFMGMWGDVTSTAPVGRDLAAQYEAMRGGKGTQTVPPASGAKEGTAAESKQAPALQTPQSMTEAAQKRDVNAIPAKVRGKIVEILQSNGKASTEANILKFYKANQDKLIQYGE